MGRTPPLHSQAGGVVGVVVGGAAVRGGGGGSTARLPPPPRADHCALAGTECTAAAPATAARS